MSEIQTNSGWISSHYIRKLADQAYVICLTSELRHLYVAYRIAILHIAIQQTKEAINTNI